jgi:hypothetical protein
LEDKMAEVREVYGAVEVNPLRGKHPKLQGTVSWTDKRLKRITRLRLLSDPGMPMWDVSYCYGVLKDGTEVKVSLPFHQLERSHRAYGKVFKQPSIRAQLVTWAKRCGVHAKGLGIFEAISTLC